MLEAASAGTQGRRGVVGLLRRRHTRSFSTRREVDVTEERGSQTGFTILRDPLELREAASRARAFETRHPRLVAERIIRYDLMAEPAQPGRQARVDSGADPAASG